MNFIDRTRMRLAKALSRDAARPLSFTDWLSYFNFNGMAYPFLGPLFASPSLGEKQEVPQNSFEGYVRSIYQRNGVIFACMLVRMLLFSEARFQYRRRVKGRPGEMFGDESLAPLETPWPSATTGDLLSRLIQDADLAGNGFATRQRDRVYRMRPDWTTIIIGSQSKPDSEYPGWELDAEIVGLMYQRGGPTSSAGKAEILLPGTFAHFAPIPDPEFRFRGMSWILPVIQDVLGDAAATTHKLKFFENGATPNIVVSLDKSVTDPKQFQEFVELMEQEHSGVLNAYRTLYLAGGATTQVVGANMRQIDFKTTQGAGETRIAMAAAVPPIIVGLSEGLASATYSNYQQARRRLVDGTMRPLWRNAAGSLSPLVDVPKGSELWYDDRDIPFLREDVKDAAEIQQMQATAVRTLIDAGFKPKSVIEAVDAGDITRLEHSGLYSVQLQSPGSQKLPETVPGETPATPAAIAPPQAQPALPAGPTPVPSPKKAGLDLEPDIENPTKPDSGPRDADESIGLTPREQQVVDRLGRQMTNKEIAAELDLSVKTVENHVNNILRKLGVSSRTQVTEVHVHMPEGMVQSTTNVQPAAPPPPANVDVHVPITVEPAEIPAQPAPRVELHVDAPDLAPIGDAIRAGQKREGRLALAVTKGMADVAKREIKVDATTTIAPGAITVSSPSVTVQSPKPKKVKRTKKFTTREEAGKSILEGAVEIEEVIEE